MAREDPRLAARLIVMTMPAAVQRLPGPLTYDLTVRELGSWRTTVGANGDGARFERVDGGAADGRGGVDFHLATDSEGLASLVAGASPFKLMLTGRMRIRGSRRK